MTLTPTRPAGTSGSITRERRALHTLALLLAPMLAALGLVLGGSSASAAPPADPASSLTWSVRPADNEHGTGRPNFAYELEPGATLTDALVVTNLSVVPLSLDVYAADGYTTPSGDLDLIPADQPSVALGSWITTEVDQVDLDAGESIEIPFTVTVPADAAVGDHPGGIVASYTSTAEHGNVRQDSRLGSRIHVRVTGEYQVALQVSEVSIEWASSWNPIQPSPAVITYTLTNTGNVRAHGTEAVAISGPGGVSERRATAQTAEIVPGDSITRSVELDRVWGLGPLSASVQISPEAVGGIPGPTVQDSVATWLISWPLVVLVAVVLLLALLLFLWWRRHRTRRAGEQKKPAASDKTAESAQASESATTGPGATAQAQAQAPSTEPPHTDPEPAEQS